LKSIIVLWARWIVSTWSRDGAAAELDRPACGARDTLWQGNFTKFAPNGKPISPITTGFYGGGFAGGTFGNEALSTRCGGQGVVIFYGMAKPVRTPQIGPAKPY
jgi:hypothetical protein